MKRAAALSLILAAAIAHGQILSGGRAGAGNAETTTTSNVALFVDPTGSDSNDCASTGAGACLTIQGAINKVPKILRHRATIVAATGSFAAFNVSGFTTDISTQQTTAGLLIDGTLTNSTVATGTATGTATAGSAGSTDTFGTLTDSGQTWAVNDLRGRFLVLTGGTGIGQAKAITSNTATAITIVGLFSPAPIAGTTYAIQDSTSLITTCGTMPPSATGTQLAADTYAIRTQGNASATTVTIRGFGISAACNKGVNQGGLETLLLNRLQFTTTAGSASRVAINGGAFIDTIISSYSGTSGTHITGGGSAASNTSVAGGLGSSNAIGAVRGTIQNSLFVNGAGGIAMPLQTTAATISENDFINLNSSCVSTTNAPNLVGNHFNCTAAAGSVGLLVSGLVGQPASSVTPQHITISNCQTAIQMSGPSMYVLSMFAVTATATITTGLDLRNGALLTVGAGNSFTASGNEISLDNGAITSTFAAIPSSGNCVASLNYFTRVCRD